MDKRTNRRRKEKNMHKINQNNRHDKYTRLTIKLFQSRGKKEYKKRVVLTDLR
jgi:hypothetical protein